MGAYKSKVVSSTVGAASDAFSELQQLGEEMRDWASGMEGTGLENTNKYSEVSEAADALENLSEPDIPAEFEGLKISYGESYPRDKRRGTSRAVRRDNACSILAGCIDALEEWKEGDGNEADAADDLINELQSLIDEAEGVEFPGMY